MGRLDGKVAVITGGGNGIGRATAIRFAEEGASVVVADVQPDRAELVAGEVEQAGAAAVWRRLDAASSEDNGALADLAVEAFGRLDLVVTAAGISHGEYRSGDLENEVKVAMQASNYSEAPWNQVVDLDRDDWQRVLDVNLTGTMLAVRAGAAKMIEAGHGGSIITIASIAAKDPDAGPIAYTVSKAGVWMLTKKLSRLLAPAGIRINAIGPGFIETNMTQIITMLPPEMRTMLDERIPMKRVGQPREIANVALFLASDEASYMTGEILHPDGGWFTE